MTAAFVSGCDRLTYGPADDGIDYTFTNRCTETIVVELATGSLPITLNVGESHTIHTLDREPIEGFVVHRVDGTGEVRFSPGLPTFDIVGERCPQV